MQYTLGCTMIADNRRCPCMSFFAGAVGGAVGITALVRRAAAQLQQSARLLALLQAQVCCRCMLHNTMVASCISSVAATILVFPASSMHSHMVFQHPVDNLACRRLMMT